ncbi:MAG: YafY family protein [Bacteroidota bacterium]
MNRLDRLTSILLILQSKRVVKAQEIADRYEISLRTVYRDIRSLEEAGVPIGAEAGIGYFLPKEYYLPPIMFTREEAGAIMLASKLVEKKTDHSILENFQSALLKLKAVLKDSEKDYLESLEDQIKVLSLPSEVRGNFQNHFLKDIQEALAERKVIEFEYFSNYSGNHTSRSAEPLGLVYYSRNWHLIAYCRLREGIRDFRTDRIAKLKTHSEYFDPEVHPSYKTYLDEWMMGNDVKPAIVRFTKEAYRHVGDHKYYSGFIDELEGEDYVEMRFSVPNLEYFARWLLMFGADVKIVLPEELRDKTISLSKELAKHYLTDS